MTIYIVCHECVFNHIPAITLFYCIWTDDILRLYKSFVCQWWICLRCRGFLLARNYIIYCRLLYLPSAALFITARGPAYHDSATLFIDPQCTSVTIDLCWCLNLYAMDIVQVSLVVHCECVDIPIHPRISPIDMVTWKFSRIVYRR